MSNTDTAARNERILGAFRARERLRRWHELQRQKKEEESNDRKQD